jgi:predicted dehydrogenase
MVIEDMVESIQTGRDPLITLASVRPTLETALAMYLSAKTNHPVSLPLVDENVW